MVHGAGNHLTSLEGVAVLRFLRYLDVNQNQISDLAALDNPNLNTLCMVHTPHALMLFRSPPRCVYLVF